MYRYSIIDTEKNPEDTIAVRVTAEIKNRDVDSTPGFRAVFDYSDRDWKPSTVAFQTLDGDPKDSIRLAAFSAVDSARKVAGQSADAARREMAES